MKVDIYNSKQTGEVEVVFRCPESKLIVISAREKSTEKKKKKRLASYICTLLEWSQKEERHENEYFEKVI